MQEIWRRRRRDSRISWLVRTAHPNSLEENRRSQLKRRRRGTGFKKVRSLSVIVTQDLNTVIIMIHIICDVTSY